MRFILTTILLLPSIVPAADINRQNTIFCVSDESNMQARHRKLPPRDSSEKARSWFSEWMMAENFGDMKSKVSFVWNPKGNNGPSIKIETTEKAHNLIRIRSRTKSSLIVVSSASTAFSNESWTFVFNFRVETMIATRVQSNIGGVKGEVITYNCQYESLDPAMGEADKNLG